MNPEGYVLMAAIDEGNTNPKINQYAFTIATFNKDENKVYYLFNDPAVDIEERPLFKVIKGLLEGFRAYTEKGRKASELLDKDLKEYFEHFGKYMNIWAFDKSSEVSKEEKKLHMGKVPDMDGAHFVKSDDKFASICDVFITVKDAGNIDDKAIVISSGNKIGEKINELLEKHCSEFKRVDVSSADNIFDNEAAKKALEK